MNKIFYAVPAVIYLTLATQLSWGSERTDTEPYIAPVYREQSSCGDGNSEVIYMFARDNAGYEQFSKFFEAVEPFTRAHFQISNKTSKAHTVSNVEFNFGTSPAAGHQTTSHLKGPIIINSNEDCLFIDSRQVSPIASIMGIQSLQVNGNQVFIQETYVPEKFSVITANIIDDKSQEFYTRYNYSSQPTPVKNINVNDLENKIK